MSDEEKVILNILQSGGGEEVNSIYTCNNF